MDRKIKILINNEFSQLATGFSTYMKYVLPYLYNTGKYEILELARYIDQNNPLIDLVPWQVIGNMPLNKQEAEIFRQDPLNQFGKFRFDKALLDFKPDIVIAIDDPWMSSPYITNSPYRKMFKHIHMVTCDGEPQKTEWMDEYAKYDRLLTYSLWAKNVLEKQSNGKLKVHAIAAPGADINIFKPLNKKEKRDAFGLKPEMFIINTVMRNQPRKLFPYLFEAFSKYLDLCKTHGREDLAAKTFLYCHTSYPDVGWNIPSELQRYGVGHKVIFTYLCDYCKSVYPSFFNGDVCKCRVCGNQTSHMPNTNNGVTREKLAEIMGMADLYIQYSTCEGAGMPINDAKSCGVPAMVVDYSAMTEQAYNGGGIPVKIKNMLRESLAGTNQFRAEPDNDDCAQKIFDFFSNTQEYRDALGASARECIENYYNWTDVAKIWENIIDNLELPNQEDTWYSKPKILQPNISIPNGLNNQQFVEYCFRVILQQPLSYNDGMFQRAISTLELGYELVDTPHGMERRPVNREIILNFVLRQIQAKNMAEEKRYQYIMGQNKNSLQFVEV